LEIRNVLIPIALHSKLLEIGYVVSAPKHNSKQRAREFIALALKPQTTAQPINEPSQTTTPNALSETQPINEPSEKEKDDELCKIASHRSKDEQFKSWNIDAIMNVGEFG
jgi:hypothetical protein